MGYFVVGFTFASFIQTSDNHASTEFGASTKSRFELFQLTESQIDAEALNTKGRNPLHILASFGQENSVAIFELFVESMPSYPINRPDAEGSSRKTNFSS